MAKRQRRGTGEGEEGGEWVHSPQSPCGESEKMREERAACGGQFPERPPRHSHHSPPGVRARSGAWGDEEACVTL